MVPVRISEGWALRGAFLLMIIVTSSFRKAPFLKCTFSVKQENEKPAFSNSSSDLKSIFEKLRFRDVLVWIVGLTVELKLRF